MKAFLVLVCACLSISASGGEKKNFKIAVTDESGAAIQWTQIFVRPEASQDLRVVSVATDRDGTAELELAPGFYDVFVGTTSFNPYATKIEVPSGKAVALKVKLKVSSLVMMHH